MNSCYCNNNCDFNAYEAYGKLKLEIENSVGSVLTYDLKITGIKYIEDSNYSDDVTFYLIENDIDNISKSINRLYSDINISIDNIDLESEQNSRYNTIYPSSKVKKNEAIISEQLNNNCDNFNNGDDNWN